MGTRGKLVSKTCSKCGNEKSLNDFHTNNRSKDGKQHRCKECAKKHTQSATKAWRLHNPESSRSSDLRTKAKLKYGLSLDEIEDLLRSQGNLCAICKKHIEFSAQDKRDKPHVDHDHKTGKVRGILCLTCNTGIGMLGDSVELLDAAKLYLLCSLND